MIHKLFTVDMHSTVYGSIYIYIVLQYSGFEHDPCTERTEFRL